MKAPILYIASRPVLHYKEERIRLGAFKAGTEAARSLAFQKLLLRFAKAAIRKKLISEANELLSLWAEERCYWKNILCLV